MAVVGGVRRSKRRAYIGLLPLSPLQATRSYRRLAAGADKGDTRLAVAQQGSSIDIEISVCMPVMRIRPVGVHMGL